MSDEIEIEARAKQMGWVPKESFHEPPEKWVDAAEFVRRGEEIMPVLRANNRRLLERVSSQEGQISALQRSVQESQEQIAELRKSTASVEKERLNAEILSLRQQLREARREGDDTTEAALESRLEDVRERVKELSHERVETTTKPSPAQDRPPVISQEVRDFIDANPWWTQNPQMRAVASALAQTYAGDAEFMAMSPGERLNRVGDETQRMFGRRREAPTEKVESPRGATGGSSGGPHTYANLPPEAKAACDGLATRVVGEGKRFKDVKEWQKHYVETYSWN